MQEYSNKHSVFKGSVTGNYYKNPHILENPYWDQNASDAISYEILETVRKKRYKSKEKSSKLFYPAYN